MSEVFSFLAGAILSFSFRGLVARTLRKLGLKVKNVEQQVVSDIKEKL